MAADENRRPISQRSRGWAKWLTATLVKANVAPNVISFTSIVWASLAGLCFCGIAIATNAGDRVMLCIGAALFCQLRLLARFRTDFDVSRHGYAYTRVVDEPELQSVLGLAGSAIVHDRFSVDPAVPRGFSGRRYEAYVRQSFARADEGIAPHDAAASLTPMAPAAPDPRARALRGRTGARW